VLTTEGAAGWSATGFEPRGSLWLGVRLLHLPLWRLPLDRYEVF